MHCGKNFILLVNHSEFLNIVIACPSRKFNHFSHVLLTHRQHRHTTFSGFLCSNIKPFCCLRTKRTGIDSNRQQSLTCPSCLPRLYCLRCLRRYKCLRTLFISPLPNIHHLHPSATSADRTYQARSSASYSHFSPLHRRSPLASRQGSLSHTHNNPASPRS